MKPFKTLFFLPLLVSLALPVLGAESYGSAVIEKGGMTLIRNGAKNVHTAGETAVPVELEDVIWVAQNSRVRLQTVEKTQLTLGSNAAFHVKPWKQEKKQGVFRMLFGRFRAIASGLTGGEEFNVKTATATIGIKGTEYTASVTPQGDVMILVAESVVQLAGLDGEAKDVAPDLLAVVVNGRQATQASLIPEEVVREIAPQKLDAPFVNSEVAKELPAEQSLVAAGIVRAKDLLEAKREKATLQDAIEIDEDIQPLDLRYPASPELYRDLLEKQIYLQIEAS